MEKTFALEALAALSQETRLDAFKLMVKHEPKGLPAGDIARELDVPHNTLSSHLAILTRAKLVISERHGRSIIFRANLVEFSRLTAFLLKDCCASHPTVYTPLLAQISPCPTGK